ncbi:glycosyltransferase [Roseburia hominis]
MNMFITRINGMALTATAQYAQKMVADIAHGLGVKDMGIFCYDSSNESRDSLSARYDGIIAGIAQGDIVFFQHPTWHNLKFEEGLINRIKAYGGRIIIVIHDVEALMVESSRFMLGRVIKLFNLAEVLVVPSSSMKEFLLSNGIKENMKFVIQEIWDYTTNLAFSEMPKLKREIHFVGNPSKFLFLDQWDYDIPLKCYSAETCIGQKVEKIERMNPERLLWELADGGFGLVWYGDEDWHQYMRYNNSFKLSNYLATGIPVIVPRGISNQDLIEKNHLGLVVSSLDEAAEMVKNISEMEYQEYVWHVRQMADLIRGGYFTKKFLVEAVHMLLRDDMVCYSPMNMVYDVSECTFEYVCLRESYRDKMALSWAFTGKADGFLICEADSGNVICDLTNRLEHYYLLGKCRKETGFIVKAYIKSIKGKAVVATSDVAALSRQEKDFRQVSISLIMPAYNSAEYIARSIDTALAQSFLNMEVIIVNDGSTDGTQEIIDWYKEKYPQVKSVYKANGGVASARNVGIERACGDYIGFMDSDDMMHPEMIGKLYETIVKNNCDIAITSAYMITNERYEKILVYPLEEDSIVSADEFLKLYIRNAYPVVWNKIYRTELVKEHLFPTIAYEDDAWTAYILSYAENICYIDKGLYGYDRRHETTLSMNLFAKPMEEIFNNHRKFIMFYLEHGNSKRRDLLKSLALVATNAFIRMYSFPLYQELKKEIEQFNFT